MKELNVIGIMSGTSLDGLDVVAVKFSYPNGWAFEILKAQTFEYDLELKNQLQSLNTSSALEYEKVNHSLGRKFGAIIKSFMNDFDFKPDFVASHGHTIFHQPENYLTTQIGHPAAIKALTGIPVIADFRTTDVHLGGQGAPLVPIGDMLLFPEYSHCLNLGGIANISIKKGSEIIAFDICVTNMTLNYLAKINGQEYDENGSIAAAGKIIPTLLEQFITLDFHRLEAPKSLGKEWFDFHLKPLLKDHLQLEPLEDVMNTMCEGIAMLISRHLKPQNNVLVTGGGTFNSYLLKRITHLSKSNLNTHNTQLINYKEALIFGFLGVLRWIQEPNILSTVTGVERNHVSGCIYA